MNNNILRETNVKPSELTTIFKLALSMKKIPSIAVMGPPGIGKSQLAKLAADANPWMDSATGESRARWFVDQRLSQMSATDLAGVMLPTKIDGVRHTEFATPSFYPRTPGGVWVMDEFTTAPKLVRNSALQWLLDSKLGSYDVPQDTLKVLMGNRKGDSCSIDADMGAAHVNRVWMFTLRVDHNDWIEWSYEGGINDYVRAYLSLQPSALYTFDGEHWDGEPFASPRSWERVSDLLNDTDNGKGINPSLRRTVFNAIVGEHGGQFSTFLDINDRLPSVEAAFMDPMNADVPQELDIQWAMACAIASRLGKDNFQSGVRYLNRMNKPCHTFAVTSAFRRERVLVSSRKMKGSEALWTSHAFASWRNDNPKIFGV